MACMRPRSLTLTSSRLRIPNAWARDIICEILATYIFVLLAIAVMAQEVIKGMDTSSIFVINLSISMGLTMAIYFGGNASGGYVNPGIALAMCLTGYMKWRKYPVYVVCHFIGAFLAAATIFGVYYESINNLDGGQRQISGVNGTGIIFSSYPNHDHLSKGTAFTEVLVAHALLVGCTLAISDSRNMNPSSGLLPIPVGLSVFTICSGFAHHTGCPINATKDLAPRLLLLAAGYGSEAFSFWDYWFWMPPVATTLGSLLATFVYQLCVGVQWKPQLNVEDQKKVTNRRFSMTSVVIENKQRTDNSTQEPEPIYCGEFYEEPRVNSSLPSLQSLRPRLLYVPSSTKPYRNGFLY